jgi:hypothetical protein
MERKFISTCILAFLVAGICYSQVRIGIKGGINVSRLNSDTEILTPSPTTENNYKITIPNYAMIGYHIGLVGQIQLFSFFIQPEALYTVTRNDINIYDLNSANPDNANPITQKLNRIDVPILVGLKFNSFKIGVGPVATFLISDDSDLKRITEYDLKLNKATLGFQAGLGFDIKKFTIELKYEGSLSKVSDGINLKDGEKMSFDSRINQIIVSAGLFF